MTGATWTLPQAIEKAFAAYRADRLDDAELCCRAILDAEPDQFDALHLRAVVLARRGRREEALAGYRRALELQPDHLDVLYNQGNCLKALNRFGEALGNYDRVLGMQPEHIGALKNRGACLDELKRFDEALTCYNRVLALRPDDTDALYHQGNALYELGHVDEALSSYDRAIAAKPNAADAHFNRGVILYERRQVDEALASYDRALAARPDFAEALHNRGTALNELRRYEEALASYDGAIGMRPDFVQAIYNRANILCRLGRLDEALATYDRALAIEPDCAEALYGRGGCLKDMRRFGEAIASYERAQAAMPNHPFALSGAADCVLRLCDWDRSRQLAAEMQEHVRDKTSAVLPFLLLGYVDDPALQLQCARTYVENDIPAAVRGTPRSGALWRHDRLRIAYLSADFRQHATAYLTAELFERHDRSRFEVIGVSFGTDDRSSTRQRIVAAFDQFHDMRGRSDIDVADFLRRQEIDIAIDLMGHTQDARPGVLARRPAPVQVNYLGYPGTMGADFIDYIVADKVVAPFEHQRFFAEKIVHLPDCYQANDTRKAVSSDTPTRREMDLPEQGFVFCCFNNNWKISPQIFDVWMRLLRQIEGSVLWLIHDHPAASQNLGKEAQRRGVDPSRLVFAKRTALDRHLARHRLADLFLDTVPYNAHTTASDALWTGLPVVTYLGEGFAARVAASLLHAAGLPELVTSSLEGYERLALRLARNPVLLAATKDKLAHNRPTCPLFNTERFTRHIEAAYGTMWDIWQQGGAPKSFSVEPIK